MGMPLRQRRSLLGAVEHFPRLGSKVVHFGSGVDLVRRMLILMNWLVLITILMPWSSLTHRESISRMLNGK